MSRSLRLARKFLGRHSRDLLAGIHGCLASPPPRLDARQKTAGMTGYRSGVWAGTAPR